MTVSPQAVYEAWLDLRAASRGAGMSATRAQLTAVKLWRAEDALTRVLIDLLIPMARAHGRFANDDVVKLVVDAKALGALRSLRNRDDRREPRIASLEHYVRANGPRQIAREIAYVRIQDGELIRRGAGGEPRATREDFDTVGATERIAELTRAAAAEESDARDAVLDAADVLAWLHTFVSQLQGLQRWVAVQWLLCERTQDELLEQLMGVELAALAEAGHELDEAEFTALRGLVQNRIHQTTMIVRGKSEAALNVWRNEAVND